MKPWFVSLVVLAIPAAVLAGPDGGGLHATFVYETGPAYVVENTGRYGADGTRYSAAEVGQRQNLYRVERSSLELSAGRHRVILAYLPFELDTQVQLAHDLVFRDTRFPAGTIVDHRYLFDGYRASYLYQVLEHPLELAIGGTFQVRNADVAFVSADGTLRADEANIGPVFAFKARLAWQPATRGPWAMVDADGFSTFGLIGSVRGAIYDVQLAIGHPVARGVDLFLGARLYGGGAKVPSREIDNWGNYLLFTAGARITLDRLVGKPRVSRGSAGSPAGSSEAARTGAGR